MDHDERALVHQRPELVNGEHAPGIKNDWPEALAATHHVLLGHGLAMPIIKRNVPDCEAGITVNLVPNEPASTSQQDRDACRAFDGLIGGTWTHLWTGYPADRIADMVKQGDIPSATLPFLKEGDLDIIATETDFLGINYYSRAVIRDDKSENNLPQAVFQTENVTDMGWEVWPLGLENILVRLKEDYAPPAIQVTENGPHTQRVRTQMASSMMQSGSRTWMAMFGPRIMRSNAVSAYGYAWSALDNFEWAFGYEKRFGPCTSTMTR